MFLSQQQHDQAENGNMGHADRPRAGATAREHVRSTAQPNLRDLLPRLRAAGVTTAVAELAGAGEGTHVECVKLYPSSDIRIGARTHCDVVAHTPQGEVRRWGGPRILAADAVREVVDGVVEGIQWANGHHGQLWIDVVDGSTRLEMHADRA